MEIALNEVSFSYAAAKKRAKAGVELPWVLRDLSVEVRSGEMLAIAGRSGSGKSTFLQLLKGFHVPTRGQVLLGGTDPHQARQPERFDRIGFIFQYPEHQLFANTVFDDIAFGLRSRKLPAAEVEQRVRRAMEAVELDYETFRSRSPFELSGGEKRRAAIAGVVVLEPEVLILDEPTAGLDLQARRALFRLLGSLRENRGTTVIWVSHQLEEILEYAPRLVALADGRFLADGEPRRLLTDPGLLAAFGWEEPLALALSRLLREFGDEAESALRERADAGGAGWTPTPEEAADAIAALLSPAKRPAVR
ncbi:energy-coupling factor ABC transporter ATP-binding protein [Gorillibacterium sp. sgz500922]|uniref:energy-coupling factor ABC transporter ATP-binding protein n=1 Tax=Gorillibacterium sp. sgz500922 TaxID=3446694 RepID=UPI003F66B03D